MIKKLIFLLIPIIGYSQITFNELMSISDEKMFKKVMIENSWRNNNSNYEEKLERENNGVTQGGFEPPTLRAEI